MRFFHNLSIRSRLYWVYGGIFLLITLASWSLLYHHFKTSLTNNIEDELYNTNKVIRDMVETTTSVAIKNHLRAIAQSNLSSLNSIYDKFLQGMLSEIEAKQLAIHLLESQVVGKTGYVYCIDSNGIAQVHPRVGVQGKDFSNHLFIQEQINRKSGYLEYLWKNPDEETEQPKALYMVYFEPWDWIVSVTSYKEEFFALIDINDFEEKILEVRIGKTGYPFVLNTQGDIIAHPEVEGNHYSTVDSNGRPFIQEIIASRTGRIQYSWQNPSESSPRKKLVVFDIIPPFDWIVATSVYADEVFKPLSQFQRLFALFLFATLVIIGIVTLLVSSTILHPLTAFIRRLEAGGEDWSIRMDSTRKDEIGRLATSFNLFMTRLESANDQLRQEIQARQDKEKQLFLYEQVFNNIVEGICIMDEHGIIQAANPAFEQISGYRITETLGNPLREFKRDQYNEHFFDTMWDSLSKQGRWSGEIWNQHKDGTFFPELLTVSDIRNASADRMYYVAVSHDISELKEKEKQITHLAYHDALTDLPNRSLLQDRLTQAIAAAHRKGTQILLLFIDLDNFKKVNDTVGHAMGDVLLQQAAQRLLSGVRSCDTVARLGGDEFIIMIPEIEVREEANAVVERVCSALRPAFVLGEHHFHLTCSIGITSFPNDGKTPDDLLKNADLAMYQAKHHGKNTFHIFDPKIEEQLQYKVRLEHELRGALENEEFQVYFQPRINSLTGKTVCLEALARWIKPGGTIVPPNMFIPLAEETGLIIPLGRQILHKAINGIQEIWRQSECRPKLSVNVSVKQFSDPGFQEILAQELTESGYPPTELELELTESLLMESIDSTQALLKWLRQEKIMLAVDDFGTGYSSMAYLKRLPISVLKIDKSFIADILTDREDFTIVETIAIMADKLNLGLVAEGVETIAQLRCLQDIGCNEVQGYLFARPMPLEESVHFLTPPATAGKQGD